MRRSVSCDGQRILRAEKKPICGVCVFEFSCVNLLHLGKQQQNQSAFIIVFVLVFELRVNIAFEN